MKRQEVALFAGLALVAVFGMGIAQAQTENTSSTRSGGAMLYANGNAKVNGQSAGISTSIFAGDRIDVADSSAVSINRSGSSIVVSPNSSIQYDPASIDVLQGTARVSTSQGMTARAGNVVVTPQDRNAKYDVIASGNNVTIVSQQGPLAVNDSGRTVALNAGSKTTLAFVAAAGQTSQASNTVAEANFLGERLSQHPFYGVVNGVDLTPRTIPVCNSIQTCLRPAVSNIHPCCCPPIVSCTQP